MKIVYLIIGNPAITFFLGLFMGSVLSRLAQHLVDSIIIKYSRTMEIKIIQMEEFAPMNVLIDSESKAFTVKFIIRNKKYKNTCETIKFSLKPNKPNEHIHPRYLDDDYEIIEGVPQVSPVGKYEVNETKEFILTWILSPEDVKASNRIRQFDIEITDCFAHRYCDTKKVSITSKSPNN